MSTKDNYKIEPIYKARAKELVDLLYDKKFINPEITRDSMIDIEDFVAFMYQSQCESAAKCAMLTAQYSGKNK